MAGKKKPRPGRKYFTPAEANATLPLVRAIVADIMALAREVHDRQERLQRIRGDDAPGEAHREELEQIEAALEADQDRFREYLDELTRLGIELKDPLTGLIDFRCWKGDREVYLCWKYGEPEVGHWHELHTGFAGRQKITPEPREGRALSTEAHKD